MTMQTKQELIHWLESLSDSAEIGIDEGGLCLRVVIDDCLNGEYNEIGGIPEEMENA